MFRKSNLAKGARRLFLHAALVFGSVVFAVPFIWLLSTSAKTPDEIFPPHWVPQIPGGVVESPYVQMRENEAAIRPVNVSEEDWARLGEPIKRALSEKAVSLANELPDFYGPHLSHPDMANALFTRILPRVPDELFTKVEPVATSFFAGNVDATLVREVFEQVYRRVALSNVAFQGWDATLLEEFQPEFKPWRVVRGEATLVDRETGFTRPSQEIHYSFAKNDSFAVQGEFPVKMRPDQLKRVTVSNHSDRSWHPLNATIELDGKLYRSHDPAFMGMDRWQDTVWQFASAEDNGVEVRSWVRLAGPEPSEYKEPGKVRVTLEFDRATQVKAAFNKYIFNYREVLRVAPFFTYAKNSTILVVLTILGQVLASSLVAYAFARLTWPARDAWFVLVLATLMIPPQVTMIPVFLIFKNLGWYNTLKPLWVTAFFGSAFYIFLLRQFMKGIPKDLEDSAKIDGCGYLGIYARIILPLVKPALATIAIFTFMATWNDFMGPLIYLSDQELYPLSLGLFSLQAAQGPNAGNYGLLMAASVLMTAPVIALFFAAQRYFIQGITLTGLKG